MRKDLLIYIFLSVECDALLLFSHEKVVDIYGVRFEVANKQFSFFTHFHHLLSQRVFGCNIGCFCVAAHTCTRTQSPVTQTNTL